MLQNKDAGSKVMDFAHGMISTNFLDRILDDQKGIINEERFLTLPKKSSQHLKEKEIML